MIIEEKKGENTVTLTKKTVGLIVIALVLVALGGYFSGVYLQKPKLEELRQNNTQQYSEIEYLVTRYNETMEELVIRENELEAANIEVQNLIEEIEEYTAEIELLQEELDSLIEINAILGEEYKDLMQEYMNLSIQPRYRLNAIFYREDFILSYDLPDRIFTSSTYSVMGETAKIDCVLWCDKINVKPSAEFRIYKAGTPFRVYTKEISLIEEGDLGKYYGEQSFTVVLEEGEYYCTIVVESGTLSSAPNYQSIIQIWEYY